MYPIYRAAPFILVALLLTACGGGGMPEAGGGGAGTAPSRGALLQSPPTLLSTVTAPSLLLELNVAANQPLLSLSGTPVCDILIYNIQYATVGGPNEGTTASGALMVPTGLGANCTGARPIVLYAHGTTTDRAFNMANLQNAETLFLAALFASHGYIVVAPNYAGYDTSTLPYHPYLIADQESKDMIDALTAARTALPFASATLAKDNGQLFITGYSQGGYVAMATHRAMQAAGMKVTASAPMSGPYALAAFVDAIFYGEVNGGATVSSTLLLTAYQRVCGTIYANAADVFEPQYAARSSIHRHNATGDAVEPGCGIFARLWWRQFDPKQLPPQLSTGRPGKSGRRLPNEYLRNCGREPWPSMAADIANE
jgi:pimeloyl-ACP methyl ester carboxylesterase